MRTSVLKGLALASAGLLATACTGTSTPGGDEGDGDAQSIRWLIEEPEDAAALKSLEQHVATFEKDSGIEVKITTLPFDTMRTVLQTQLRSGEGPDVFNWGSGPSFGGALARNGLIYDLTDAYEENGWEIYDFAKEEVTVDGKVYGVPGELETIGLFYNKEIFDELGLQAPESLEDLDAVSQELKSADIIPMSVGDKDAWPGGHLLSMTLSSAIGSDGMEQLFSGDKSWDSPEVVAALELWQDYNEQEYLPESPTSVAYETMETMFYTGKAAMIPTGSWLVGEMDDNADFEVGYIPFPGPDGPGIFAGGLGSGPFISAGTSKTDAALEFVDFLASPEHGEWTVENFHTIPPQPIDTQGLDVSPLLAQVLEDTAQISDGGDFGYNIDVKVSDAVNEAMYDGVQGVLTGQRTPEQVAEDLQAAAQE
ncbi:MAG: ABC transporter, substrate-binding protein (cluster 1, maltose/g3p/polyamine/iron) [uncultured Nocardioidaceae bacterium]|uniref:ABC transporter, substrate-binding protein (Cluster 1, maltose/g3p/polyamine/iron) n=1 Tax=uncultured Nocardioidaceae bacterium TaxID=253824 RepID=A0A6J4LK43_9ACTN|nr:MAG: ABC transporter, substrate-binding protein (cluster 1, maltose/g3p/polyamine/iron) [uncultured Nocardioidaceae bacterium]